MIKNYLVTAFREISKNKIFSLIHIFGLALGIAAFVLILQYAFYELSYEKFYKNADQIYRVRQDRYNKGKLSTTWGAGCARDISCSCYFLFQTNEHFSWKT